MQNNEFIVNYSPNLLTYDLPEKIYPLKEYLGCLPSVFGYDQLVGDKVFPKVGYPRC